MTYSILAADPDNDAVGIAVASCWPAVGAVVPALRRSVGAAASQGDGDPALARQLVDELRDGRSSDEALEAVLRSTSPTRRQFAVIDAGGSAAVYTGEGCVAPAGSAGGDRVVALGNMAGGPGVPAAMIEGFGRGEGDVTDRLLAGLVAGLQAGGDARGEQSAALHVAGPLGLAVNVRVDHADHPLDQLGRAACEQRALAVLDASHRDEDVDALTERVLGLADTEQVRFWLALRLAEHGRDDEAADLVRRLSTDPWHRLLERAPWPSAAAIRRRLG